MNGHSHSSLPDPSFRGQADLQTLWSTLSRSLRWLLIGPVLVGAVTFFVVDWAPKRYVSTALLNPGAGEAEPSDPILSAWKASMLKTVPALMTSPDVLKAAGSAGIELAASQVKARANPSEGTISVAVTASSPAQAQQLTQALLKATIAASGPTPDERPRLEAERKRLNDQIRLLETTAHQVREALSRASNAQEVGALAAAVPSVMEHTVTLERRLTLNTARLTGRTQAAIVTAPTLPTAATGPRRGLWAAIAALGTLCLLISAVLLRQAWLDLPRTGDTSGHTPGQPQDQQTKPLDD